MALKQLFFKKIPKNRPATVIRLSKLVYLHNFPNLDVFICNFFFKPSPFRKLSVKCQTRPRLLIFHSTISLSHKKFLFRKFLMTSLHVVFGLPPPPNQKSWLRLCTGDGISSRVPPNHCLCSPSESKLLEYN